MRALRRLVQRGFLSCFPFAYRLSMLSPGLRWPVWDWLWQSCGGFREVARIGASLVVKLSFGKDRQRDCTITLLVELPP